MYSTTINFCSLKCRCYVLWGDKFEAANTIKMPANAIFPTNYGNPQVQNYKFPQLLCKTASLVLVPQFVYVVLATYINS